ncbi:hypothetical protein AK830_g3572 [Neonectria ditissima]|uniref:COX assembly mitochondrial protein n=1 Tax=Neonectria ditissima TaxID=78410 RepID=A0A0P7BPZ7_9HYPO|nr:hypothetical protein AK830_g3572 [Neonectria ditissima]
MALEQGPTETPNPSPNRRRSAILPAPADGLTSLQPGKLLNPPLRKAAQKLPAAANRIASPPANPPAPPEELNNRPLPLPESVREGNTTRPADPLDPHGRNGRPEPARGGGEARCAVAESPAAVGLAGGAAFAACALGRTFTVSFVCRPEHRVMNNCMKLHATQDEHDAARVEWFSMRLERQRERAHKNKVAAAQEEFMREWWGLPEHVRLSRQKEMEERGERIHGLTARDLPSADGEKKR